MRDLKEHGSGDTRYFHRKFSIDLYEWDVHIFFCHMEVDRVRALPEVVKIIGHEPSGVGAALAFHEHWPGTKTSYIFVKYNSTYHSQVVGTLAHECLHCSWAVLDYIGGRAAVLSEEPHAYLLEYVLSKVDKFAMEIYDKYGKKALTAKKTARKVVSRGKRRT